MNSILLFLSAYDTSTRTTPDDGESNNVPEKAESAEHVINNTSPVDDVEVIESIDENNVGDKFFADVDVDCLLSDIVTDDCQEIHNS